MSSARRRRILMVARNLPSPADDGYRIRVRNLAAGLARNHEVVLVGHAEEPSEDRLAELQAVGITAVPVPYPRTRRRRDRVRGLASPDPRLAWMSEHRLLRQAVGWLTSSGSFDVVQLESSEFATLPLPARVPVIIDEHNVWSELRQRRSALRRPSLRRLADRLEVERLRRFEYRAWVRAAGVVFTSDREVDIARGRLPTGRFATVPNGVDVDLFRPGAVPATEVADRLVFVGLLAYTPNVDAVRYFARAILPAIRAVRPSVELHVVGKETPPAIRQLAGPGIRIVGPVPDVRPALAQAAVVVVPLRAGSGTRLKILEALAMGRAVVSTSIGAEGLDTRSGDQLLVADRPEDFGAAVLGLLDDAGLRSGLGRRGREFVVEHHGWPAIVERLEAFHDEVLLQ